MAHPPWQGTSAASCPPGSSPFSGVQLQDSAADAPGSPSKRSAALDLTDAVISLQTGLQLYPCALQCVGDTKEMALYEGNECTHACHGPGVTVIMVRVPI